MPFTTAAKNSMLDNLGVAYVSAHTADPGETGTSEVSGGSYARVAITYNPAAGGAIDSSNTPQINIPAGTTVTHVGYWTALTGGTFLAYSDIADETFTNAGTLTIADSDLDLNG